MATAAMRFALSIALGVPDLVFARDTPGTPGTPETAASPREPEARPPGLPSDMDCTFNFDAGFGSFSFFASLFTNPHDYRSGDSSDNWLGSRPGGPASHGDGVTSSELAFEVSGSEDWKLNQNVTLNLVGGFANPGEAVQQAVGRTGNFGLGMLYFACSY